MSQTQGSSTSHQSTTPAHHGPEGFRNPYHADSNTFFKFFKARFFGPEKWANYEADAHLQKVVSPPLDKIHSPNSTHLQALWIGHSTVLLQYQGFNILTDPVFSRRASPVSFSGPKRVVPPGLPLKNLPPIHHVLISHNHYDHLDKPSLIALGDAPIYHVPLGLKKTLISFGIKPQRIYEYDWEQEGMYGQVSITATPAQHWSSRSGWDRNKTLWCSFVLKIKGVKIWFAGDTGYNPIQFRELGRIHGPFDFSLIPIGAYSPRSFMKGQHINPSEAVTIHQEVKSKSSMAIHWGTFPLTAEPLMEPAELLQKETKALNWKPGTFDAWAIGEMRTLELLTTPGDQKSL